VLWMCPARAGWYGGSKNGPEFIPADIVPEGCAVTLDNFHIEPKNDIVLHDAVVWREPNEITGDRFISWIERSATMKVPLLTESLPDSSEAEPGREDEGTAAAEALADSTDVAIEPETAEVDSVEVSRERQVTLPAGWSDSWNVLATVRETFPLRSYSSDELGEPTRIRVRQAGDRDFFVLFSPRLAGESPPIEITDHGAGYVSFEDRFARWEVQAGENAWTDARLSVKIETIDGVKGVYAFDCTRVEVGTETFSSPTLFSLYYSPLEGAGIIMSTRSTEVSTSRVDFKMHAGEIGFYDFHGDVWFERTAFLSTLSVIDGYGEPVEGARIDINDRFAGLTGKDGTFPVRWSGTTPEVSVSYGEQRSFVRIRPGDLPYRIATE